MMIHKITITDCRFMIRTSNCEYNIHCWSPWGRGGVFNDQNSPILHPYACYPLTDINTYTCQIRKQCSKNFSSLNPKYEEEEEKIISLGVLGPITPNPGVTKYH